MAGGLFSFCVRTFSEQPRYSYSLEDGVPIAAPDAKERFADNRAAIEHAKLIAKDLARSLLAQRGLRVVVRNEAGVEIGAVPLVPSGPPPPPARSGGTGTRARR